MTDVTTKSVRFWTWFWDLANPTRFLGIANWLIPVLAIVTFILLGIGLYLGFSAPQDYQQGATVQIMFIHVPSSWIAMMCYSVMSVSALGSLVWRHPLADVSIRAAAPIGAAFTFLALLTGSLWGKPMWGTWWVWDARLTSELILLFLYLGVIALHSAIDDKRTAARAVAILALVGVINIPIIHYSVEWWNTLHQGPTVTKLDKPSIHLSMLIPLLLMAVAFKLYYAFVVLMRARCEVLERERVRGWVQELVRSK
jgi:heme exporter protein C